MANAPQVAGVNLLGVLYLVLVMAAVFLPMILGRGGPSPGQSDSDSDGGGGGGPPRPPTPPDTPGGGIPLNDAEPARVRLRGHDRFVDLLPARGRRPSPEPARRRVRTLRRG
ncbi:MAG TPA: hypothetical protein VMB27_06115 [Solirubrobacteraceae bacterium]|nr:hypothetical protein [Solirubrobacteraceae bacterium]